MTKSNQPLSHMASALDQMTALTAPIDIAWLVYFRIAFGLIMLWEVWRYFSHGWIGRYFIYPDFHFTYSGFAWLRPWPGNAMYIHFAVLGALAVCIMLGWRYRLATSLFFVGFTYIFLVDKALYLNHFYLVVLISFLMILLPAQHSFSLDSWQERVKRSSTVPAWTRWLLLFQIGLVYFYGGIAKLNGDWMRGEPMRQWLAERTDLPMIGPWLIEPWAPYFFSYGGLLFDLLIVPALLWRRTRPLAFAVAIFFHLTNVTLFSIGIFPWFMIAATAVFFPPDWPRCLVGIFISTTEAKCDVQRPSPILWGFLTLYVALQVSLPLRHFAYPGNVSWTEEGHRFSWHMKLRTKDADARFFATVEGQVVEIIPDNYLSSRQLRKMPARPDMIVQFAHYLADGYADIGIDEVEIYVYATAALNGREPQLLIDPEVDLLSIDPNEKPASWIMPSPDPLQKPWSSDFSRVRNRKSGHIFDFDTIPISFS